MSEDPRPMTEPITPEEEAKFRESVRMIGEDAEGGWWSNRTAARLLATIDEARADAQRLRKAAQQALDWFTLDAAYYHDEYGTTDDPIDALRVALARDDRLADRAAALDRLPPS